MILAAGRGERLKPFTELKPKALCIVSGKPLIEHHIINLSQSGFNSIIINHAYLGGLLRQHLGNGDKWNVHISYSPEPPGAFETGGGILNALQLIKSDIFLTINADIYTDFDFSTLKMLPDCLAHAVLVHNNLALGHCGDFGIKKQKLCNDSPNFTFSGISIYHRTIFEDCRYRRFSMAPMLRLLSEKKLVSAQVYRGIWHDIGTAKRLENII